MRLGLLLPLLLSMSLPGLVTAQAGTSPKEPLRARGTAGIVLKGTSIAGTDRVLLGGWAGLTFGDHFSLGGGGVALLREVHLTGSGSGTGFELGMGYGGILLGLHYPLRARVGARLGILLGAGHAEVRDRLTGREVGADNFGVLEPEAALSLPLLSWLHLGGGVGYRMTWGVGDIPLVQPEEFRGATGTLSLRVGGH